MEGRVQEQTGNKIVWGRGLSSVANSGGARRHLKGPQSIAICLGCGLFARRPSVEKFELVLIDAPVTYCPKVSAMTWEAIEFSV